MAPQTSIPASANTLGTIGTAAGVFRIYVNWRRKNTDGLPGSMLVLWAICGVPFGTYAIAQNFNIPLQIQPQILCLLSLISWMQTLIYHELSKWPTWKAVVITFSFGITLAGVEVALIITLKPLYERGVSFPMTIVGIVAALFLAGGLLPPYYEIWKRRGRVIGINWIFLCVDWLGAFFSLMALVAQNTFDYLGGLLYIVCLALELGIAAFHIVWLFRTRKIRRKAKQEGKTFDEFLERFAQQDPTFAFSERRLRPTKRINRPETEFQP